MDVTGPATTNSSSGDAALERKLPALSSIVLCSLFLTVFVLGPNAAGQNAPASFVKHNPVNVAPEASALPAGAPQLAVHERFATFLAGDFKSVFLLQNFRSDVPVTVTPMLMLSTGEVSMDPVTLQPHSATTVDINAFLKSRGLSDTQGTALMRYTFSPYAAVSGVVLASDEAHHLYVNSYAQSPEEYWQGTSYDATLWAPDDTPGAQFPSSIRPRNSGRFR